MTIRLSTGARNGLAGSMGFGGMFNRGYMKIFSGSQPASADAAETGTLLGTVTDTSGTPTKETRATGTITITGATGGTISEPNASATTNGRFYGVVTGTPRPFREPGLEPEDAVGQAATHARQARQRG